MGHKREKGLQKVDGKNRKQWKRIYVQANDWNDQAKAEECRFRKNNHESRVDHRFYERKGVVTERGNQNLEISRLNQILFAIKTRLMQFKDWLKDALTLAANTIKTEKPDQSDLSDLYARFDAALKNLRQVDMRLKSANGAVEYNKILPERHRAYAEYSALKTEVKNAEKNLVQKKPRARGMER